MAMSVLRCLLPVLIFVLLPVANNLRAADEVFSVGLHPDVFTGIGLTALSPDELANLNQLVARELAAARQGRVTAFRGTFCSRRTAAESAQAGLDKLSADGRDRLDRTVAQAIAASGRAVAPTTVTPAKDPGGVDVSSALAPEVHGAVTLGYGTGRGGSYRFGGVDTWYYDPQSRVTLALGVSAISGTGFSARGPGRGCWRY